MARENKNPWKGFILGALGGIAGIVAMRAYWKAVTQLAGYDPRKAEKQGETPDPFKPLDDISLIGQHYEPGESTTAALGRIAYEQATGKEPGQETKTTLSYIIHWLLSMFVSGIYGALRGKALPPDVPGGLTLGTSLWLFGDEMLMPLTGLADGPTAYPTELHAHGWGAHLAYGLASSWATQTLYLFF